VGYHLGVDLGTTYTAAAVERDGRVQVVTLGNRTVSIPSVVFATADGTVLVGDAAERRGLAEPERLAREFKRRVGDPTPIILGGAPWGAEALMGKVLRWVVDRVTELEGGPPSAVALTHPANWGAYKLDLLEQAARHADVAVVRMLSEPEAAATAYASQERVEPGSIIAVYDLGGGTFDAAVLRKRDDGFDILGQPEGVERLGGVDVDQAVFAHVTSSLGGVVEGLDHADRDVVAAVGRLRRDCVDAKEALSADTDVSIPVALPGLATEVRLTRSELEGMVRPALGETVVALRRALRSAGVGPEHVSAVLLVGGSSRIPLVAQLVGGELGRPIAVDANPKDTVALGAAVAAAQAVGAGTPESVTPLPTAPVAAAPVEAAPAWVSPAPATPPPAPLPPATKGSRSGLVAALVAFVALAVGAAFVLLGGGGDGGEQAGDDGTTRTVEAEQTTTTATVAAPTTTVPADYTPAVREEFISTCVAESGADLGDPQGFCTCAMDEIQAAIPFDRFVELDREARETGEPAPEIQDAIQPCVDTFS
jgi:molecular chaperone DnaK